MLGEPLALELANTVVATEDGGVTDLLRSGAGVAAWMDAHRDRLPAGSSEEPPSPAALRRLRDAVRELATAALDRRAPDPGALDHVNSVSASVPVRAALRWEPSGDTRVADATAAPPGRRALAAIARSAVDLIGGDDRQRLRRCEAPGCVLLFVAANPRRRWCSAATCGNRVRVARHYARQRRGDG